MTACLSLDDMQKKSSTDWRKLDDSNGVERRRCARMRGSSSWLCCAGLRTEFPSGTGEIVGRRIENVVFRGSDLRGVTLRNCSLVDVEVRRTDLGTAKFVECNARDVLLLEPRVKVGTTRLELTGLRVPEDVFGLQELGTGGSERSIHPKKLRRFSRSAAHLLRWRTMTTCVTWLLSI